MKVILSFTILALNLVTVAAQTPSVPGRGANSPSISPKDVRVVPFARDMETEELNPKTPKIFDELTVATSQRIHIYGKKKIVTGAVNGRAVAHLGKLALLPPVARTGTLTAKIPSADDVTYYYIALELPDSKLDTKLVTLKANKTYNWEFASSNGESSITVRDETGEIASVKEPTEKVKGVGFAATVRWKGNEADLAIMTN